MPLIFRVGGCVRDAILGIKSKDIDFTFVLDDLDKTVEQGFAEMKMWMEERKFEIFLETPKMFTIRAKFPIDHKHKNLVADFVMARKEIGYIEGTRNPILKLGTLEDDLIRRDFTVNAMAEDDDGNIIDLFGGKLDLERKTLRTPLDPSQTMFDDPLRILRALRFSITKGFNIDYKIWEAFNNPLILDKLRTTVSQERIRNEIDLMMKADTIKSLVLLHDIDTHHIPGFLKLVFGNGMWLKPTFEKI